jgi:hypothetical protein
MDDDNRVTIPLERRNSLPNTSSSKPIQKIGLPRTYTNVSAVSQRSLTGKTALEKITEQAADIFSFVPGVSSRNKKHTLHDLQDVVDPTAEEIEIALATAERGKQATYSFANFSSIRVAYKEMQTVRR